MPNRKQVHQEWAEAFESGTYRPTPIETPRVDVTRLRRGRPRVGVNGVQPHG